MSKTTQKIAKAAKAVASKLKIKARKAKVVGKPVTE
jgi:hypothetical protein